MPSKKEKARKLKFSDELAEEFSDDKREKFLYRDCETGELLEVDMAYGEFLERETAGGFIKISENSDARRALNDEFERDGMATRQSGQLRTRAKWPMVSIRAGVNPSQRQELREYWKKKNVSGCEVLANGDIKYESRAARKADHEARGLFDRSGGYGDAMPRNL